MGSVGNVFFGLGDALSGASTRDGAWGKLVVWVGDAMDGAR